ncbi:MAG: PfkB family carbohydrate kinase [Verrucomicrobiota bacterium]|jgi:sugar/nucleoside kinase (ribokinase family)
MTPPELRAACARHLLANSARAATLSAFVGLDGFVDEILHVVDKRESAECFQRLPTIARLAERLAAAAGRSGNLELVPQLTKLGGNGPIMANALASFGLQVTYLGALGYPGLHPVFRDFAAHAEVHSIAQPGTTDALEFDDGKIMLGKHATLQEVTWENIQARYGLEKFTAKFNRSDLVAFVNWTMLPYMSDLWEALLRDVCPALNTPRRLLFFDLADPEKRTPADILRALDLIARFNRYFEVILGLNEKEALAIAQVLGLHAPSATPESLAETACRIAARLPIGTLVVHPVASALAVTAGQLSLVQGPWTPRPKVTTGAGDHFNSGFCLGKLLGLDNELSLLAGVATSGFYVRTAQSPAIAPLADFLTRGW